MRDAAHLWFGRLGLLTLMSCGDPPTQVTLARADDTSTPSDALADADALAAADADADAAPTDGALVTDAQPTLPPDGPAPDAASSFLGLSAETLGRAQSLAIVYAPPPDSTNRYADLDAAAQLGQRVFFEGTLSPRGLSCAFCHVPANAFSSALTYDGFGGLDFRNVPPLVNVAWQRWYFWDGRADSAWAQFVVPFEKHDELGASRVDLTRALSASPVLAAEYAALFGPLPDTRDAARFPPGAKPTTHPPDVDRAQAWAAMAPSDQRRVNQVVANVGKAVAAYERRLIGGTSPLDAFLDAAARGDTAAAQALPEEARRGLALFVGPARCVDCHAGPTLSDGEFHNLGLAPPHPRVPVDRGRETGAASVAQDVFNARGDFSDDRVGPGAQRVAALVDAAPLEGAFRTPTLRNVALTAPYFHDGRFETLEQVVRFKAAADSVPAVGERDPALRPVELSAQDVDDLVAFMRSLTDGPLPDALTRPLP